MELHSYDDRFHLKKPGVFRALWRDARLLWFLGTMAWRNLTVGRRVRRRYRACRAAGQPFYMDDPQ